MKKIEMKKLKINRQAVKSVLLAAVGCVGISFGAAASMAQNAPAAGQPNGRFNNTRNFGAGGAGGPGGRMGRGGGPGAAGGAGAPGGGRFNAGAAGPSRFGVGGGAAAGAEQPTGLLEVIPPTRTMPAEYSSVMLIRSIFQKGRIVAADPNEGHTRVVRPEDSLVFSGYTQPENGPSEAFIENVNTMAMLVVKDGGKAASNAGIVSNIQFGSLDYTGANGVKVHILIGQSLAGTDSWRATDTYAPQNPIPKLSQLQTGNGNVITAPGSSADVLARLQAKRQAELSQINGNPTDQEAPTVDQPDAGGGGADDGGQ